MSQIGWLLVHPILEPGAELKITPGTQQVAGFGPATQFPEQHGVGGAQATLVPIQDCAKDAEGAIRDEIIGNATTEANPTFLIASLLYKPGK